MTNQQLLLECAEAFEENCEHEGRLASFVALAQRCRAACAESEPTATPAAKSATNTEVATQPFNRLTPAEAERLALLAEECGEAIQAIGKILRHGYESNHPDFTETNRTQLMKEIGDIYAAVGMMAGALDVDPDTIDRFSEQKTSRVRYYMHHQRKP